MFYNIGAYFKKITSLLTISAYELECFSLAMVAKSNVCG
jgi:hypothetical protein